MNGHGHSNTDRNRSMTALVPVNNLLQKKALMKRCGKKIRPDRILYLTCSLDEGVTDCCLANGYNGVMTL